MNDLKFVLKGVCMDCGKALEETISYETFLIFGSVELNICEECRAIRDAASETTK